MFCLCVKTHEVGACDLNGKVKIFLKIRFCLHRLVVFFSYPVKSYMYAVF